MLQLLRIIPGWIIFCVHFLLPWHLLSVGWPLDNPPRPVLTSSQSIPRRSTSSILPQELYFAHAPPHFPLALSLHSSDDDATLCHPSQQCTQYDTISTAALMLLATTLRVRPPEQWTLVVFLFFVSFGAELRHSMSYMKQYPVLPFISEDAALHVWHICLFVCTYAIVRYKLQPHCGNESLHTKCDSTQNAPAIFIYIFLAYFLVFILIIFISALSLISPFIQAVSNQCFAYHQM